MRRDQRSGWVTGGIVGAILIGVLMFSEPSKTDEQKKQIAKRQAEKDVAGQQEAHRKGFDCLNPWDGSSTSFKNMVKAALRDPDSFEHIDTQVGPIDKRNRHAIYMRFRSRNGFGGMNVAEALGSLDADDCTATVTRIE